VFKLSLASSDDGFDKRRVQQDCNDSDIFGCVLAFARRARIVCRGNMICVQRRMTVRFVFVSAAGFLTAMILGFGVD
jgi:hypothetical protein